MGKVDGPEAIGGFTRADDGGGAIFDKFDVGGGKNGIVAIITKLSNRHKGFSGEPRKDMGLTSL